MEEQELRLKNWEQIESEEIFDCSPWFKVFKDTWLLPNQEKVTNFSRIEGRDYVIIVAVNNQKEFLVMNGYRPGCEEVILQFPAGYVDSEDNEPLISAKRELLEETSIKAEDWKHIGSFTRDGNWKINTIHGYLAQNLSEITDKSVESDDLGEVIISWMSWESIYSNWRKGKFKQVETTAILGLVFEMLKD